MGGQQRDPLGEVDTVVIVHDLLMAYHTDTREQVYREALNLDPDTSARVVTAAVAQLYAANVHISKLIGMPIGQVVDVLVNMALELREERDTRDG